MVCHRSLFKSSFHSQDFPPYTKEKNKLSKKIISVSDDQSTKDMTSKHMCVVS